MKVINRIFLVALIAGGIAGLLLAELQYFVVAPLVLEVETYGATSNQLKEAWPIVMDDGQIFFTVFSNIMSGILFGLLLAACYLRHRPISWSCSIIWGLAGFFIFHLAPAFVQPQEFSVDAAVSLAVRETWWWLTVVTTALGFWMIAFKPVHYLKLSGAVLIALPHLLITAQPDVHNMLVSEELRGTLIHTSLICNAIFWMLLGPLSAFFYNRIRGVSEIKSVFYDC